MIIECDHISVLVSDLVKSSAFYEDVLGLSRLLRPDLGFDGVWLSLGKTQALHLLKLPNPESDIVRPAHAGRDRHIAFRVSDMNDAKARLSQAGIHFTLSQSGRNSIFCRDPDGNGIELLV